MKEQKKWNKGGVAAGEDRVKRLQLRKSRAYHRPTKGELYEQIAEDVQEYGFDVEQDKPEDYIGLESSDFINLFLLMGMGQREAELRYKTEVAELDAVQRATYRAQVEESYNEAHCKTCFGEAWA